jgi:hypothetical protein
MLVIVALGVAVSLPNTRINTSSQMTGVVCFLGLYRTLRFVGVTDNKPLPNAIVVALMASATCTFRQNYIAAVAILLMVSYGAQLWKNRSQSWPARLREPALAAAGLVALLLPWMILSYRSSRTFLFPVVQGNFRPGYPMLEHAPNAWAELSFQIANFSYNEPVHTLPLFVLAAVFSRQGERKALHALLIGSILAAIYLVHSFSATDTQNLGRYYFGFMVATVFATLLDAGEVPEGQSRAEFSLTPAAMIALLAGLLQIHEVRGNTFSLHDADISAIRTELLAKESFPLVTDGDNHYRELQESIPPKVALFVMVDEPFRLDHRRNVINNIDIPGCASPERALPIFEGPEAVAKYLQAHSMRYVAFVLPDRSANLYRRDIWERHRKGSIALWRDQAPFYLDVMENLEKLSKTRKHMRDVSGMIMLDLATLSPAEEMKTN